MTIVDTGRGSPIVLVPGLQGRWEYLSPAVDALARSHRVITFSLCDERRGRHGSDATRGLDTFVEQIEATLVDRGVGHATICGVSLGGRVALRFAARRPERTDALVLVSVPGPAWHLKPSHRKYARFPWLFAPLFFAGIPGRLEAELAAAFPDRRERGAFARRQLQTILRAPVSPSRMAARARLVDGMDAAADCARISAPTLVMTGEAALDHVVPADGTCEYARLIAGARAVILERTGHLGCLTRPDAFADAVGIFLEHAGVTRSNEHAA